MPERRARRRPGQNRERLLEAGLIEFGLFGYHGAVTAAIAQRADVPQPHVYANFTGKQELFLACLAVASERLHAVYRDLFPAGPELEAPSGGSSGVTGPPSSSPEQVKQADASDSEDFTFATLLLFQAVAVARDPELGAAVRPAIEYLRSLLGEDAFRRVIAAAAASLSEF